MKDIMIKKPKTVDADELAVRALSVMEKNSITVLMVPDKKGKPCGILHLHDLLKSGVV
jgi:arabinose-5-phosphate isomerase